MQLLFALSFNDSDSYKIIKNIIENVNNDYASFNLYLLDAPKICKSIPQSSS